MRFAACLLLAGALAGTSAPAASAATITWIRKTAGSYVCYVPAATWQAVGNQNGIDVSSPTGDEDVSLAQTAWPAVLAPQTVATQLLTLFERNGSMSNASLTGSSPATQTAAGTQQRFTFRGVHHWVNGTEPIVGYLYVTIVNQTGARGFITSLVYAPTTKASADAAMLEFIRGHITYEPANR